MDNTVKTPDDVTQQLGLPFLGMVPTANAARASLADRGDPPLPIALREPQSAAAEAYRVIRTNLIFSAPSPKGRLILFGSANPGEGKTTSVANLAASLAQNGARVLAVDADLRRPTLHRHFGLEHTPGLSDLVVGRAEDGRGRALHRHRRPFRPALRLHPAQPGGAAGLGRPARGPAGPAQEVRLGAGGRPAHPGHGRHPGALPLRGRPRARGLVGEQQPPRPAPRPRPDRAGGGQAHGGRAQQGRPPAQRLLLRPALRRVLPQVLRGRCSSLPISRPSPRFEPLSAPTRCLKPRRSIGVDRQSRPATPALSARGWPSRIYSNT